MIDVTLTCNGSLSVSLSTNSPLAVALDSGGEIQVDLSTPTYLAPDIYGEEVEVTPNFDGITLATANKFLANNITIDPIPVERVSNLSGGITVYIGGI